MTFSDWEQEYQLYCEEQEVSEESFEPWYDVQQEIDRCNRVNRKRKKHIKDNPKQYWWYLFENESIGVSVGQGRVYCGWELSWHYHKHRRAEKVYEKEEYFDNYVMFGYGYEDWELDYESEFEFGYYCTCPYEYEWEYWLYKCPKCSKILYCDCDTSKEDELFRNRIKIK